MPVVKGKAACKPKNRSKNIAAEIRSGKPRKQAIKIGYEYCRRSKKKPSKRR